MTKMNHEFVQFIPKQLQPETLYVSIEYCTASHLCVCGCGNKVVTPISPTDWQIAFDGESISLYPSIGNWNFECKSHYWITNGKVKKARQWSEEEIAAGREMDLKNKIRYYQKDTEPAGVTEATRQDSCSFWSKFKSRF